MGSGRAGLTSMVITKHPKRALTGAELQAMREQCKSKRDLAIFEFLRSTLCRAHEMLSVRIEDADLERGRVFFRKTKAKPIWKKVKGKMKFQGSQIVTRYSFFDRKAAVAVRDYIAERRGEGARDEDPLFTIDQNENKDGRMTRNIIKSIARAAKIPDWMYISPHYLRHTRATQLRARGYPTEYIKDTGGWSRKSNTFETIYDHPDVDMMQRLYKKLKIDEEE